MGPTNAAGMLSPAELSYIRDNITQVPPIRPDARAASEQRQISGERGVLTAANGSGRAIFAGSEAVAGLKAEPVKARAAGASADARGGLEIIVTLPGATTTNADEDAGAALGSALAEAAMSSLPSLKINSNWTWKLSLEVVLLSGQSPSPLLDLPVLSTAVHLALADTRLPRLISQEEEDPMFDDDWAAARSLYPNDTAGPAVWVLVGIAGSNLLVDPSGEEAAAADGVLAVALHAAGGAVRTVGARIVVRPAVPAAITPEENAAVAGASGAWQPPRGGIARAKVALLLKAAAATGGELLAALREVPP